MAFPTFLLTLSHRRSMEKEAKANRRRCLMGENCRAHAVPVRQELQNSDCVADELIRGGQGQKYGGVDAREISVYSNKSSRGNCINAPNELCEIHQFTTNHTCVNIW